MNSDLKRGTRFCIHGQRAQAFLAQASRAGAGLGDLAPWLGWRNAYKETRGKAIMASSALVVFKGMMYRPLERFKDFGQMTLGVGVDIAFKLLECGKEKRSFFCER